MKRLKPRRTVRRIRKLYSAIRAEEKILASHEEKLDALESRVAQAGHPTCADCIEALTIVNRQRQEIAESREKLEERHTELVAIEKRAQQTSELTGEAIRAAAEQIGAEYPPMDDLDDRQMLQSMLGRLKDPELRAFVEKRLGALQAK